MIFWLTWPFNCPILMILTMTKYHKNLLSDSLLSFLFIVNFFFLGNQDNSKITKWNLFKNHPISRLRGIFRGKRLNSMI